MRSCLVGEVGFGTMLRFSCGRVLRQWGSVTDSRSARRHFTPEASRRPFLILSLDGGGVRGLLTVKLLQRLEQEVPGFIERVDLRARRARFRPSRASPSADAMVRRV